MYRFRIQRWRKGNGVLFLEIKLILDITGLQNDQEMRILLITFGE
jgi:hypothetical protein